MAGFRDAIRRFNRFRRLQKRKFLLACGFDLYIKSQDRDVLERTIFPYVLKRTDLSEILFVGCHWYTKGYSKWFEEKNYWTLDHDVEQAKYGAGNHILDSIENIRLHFEAGVLDVIICNGVFGWGLNTREHADRAFNGCYDCLREGGLFLLGWNDVPDHAPFPPAECESLKRFSPFVFPAFSASRYLSDSASRHIYDFYVKPPATEHLARK